MTDFAAGLTKPDNPARLAPAFDPAAGVYSGDAGSRALANALDLALFT